MAQVTVSNQEYTLTLRALNGMAGAASAMGLTLGDLDPDGLIRAACKAEGLDDMGDPSFRIGLERLVRNIDESNFSHFARILTRQTCIHALRNRLRCEAYIKKHPEVLEIPIERPLFVLGFPRTGTPLLQNLIGQASDRRALRFWELNSPTPLHSDAERDQKRRVAAAERVLQAALDDLVAECRDANLSDGETKVMSRTLGVGKDEKTVKIACVKGDETALRSAKTMAVINSSRDLCDVEKESFREQVRSDGNLDGGEN